MDENVVDGPNRGQRRAVTQSLRVPGFHSVEKALKARRKRAIRRKLAAFASRGNRGKRHA